MRFLVCVLSSLLAICGLPEILLDVVIALYTKTPPDAAGGKGCRTDLVPASGTAPEHVHGGD